MVASVLSNAAGNRALAAVFGVKGLYLALHLEVPPPDGSGEEVSAGGYARQPISFTTPAGKGCASSNAQSFAAMPACTVKAISVWTALSGGDMLLALLLAPPLVVAASARVSVAVGDVAVSL